MGILHIVRDLKIAGSQGHLLGGPGPLNRDSVRALRNVEIEAPLDGIGIRILPSLANAPLSALNIYPLISRKGTLQHIPPELFLCFEPSLRDLTITKRTYFTENDDFEGFGTAVDNLRATEAEWQSPQEREKTGVGMHLDTGR